MSSIVLNGKKYDAKTGALLGTVSDSQFQPIKKSPHAVTKPHTITPTTVKPVIKSTKNADRSHHAPKGAKRKPVGSKTLMRTVVKKPKHVQHPIVKKHYPAATTSPLLTPKPSAHSVDTNRLHRAKQIGKSARIGKFQNLADNRIMPKITPVAVAVAPAHTTTRHHKTPVKSPKDTLFEQALAHAKSHEQPPHKVSKKKLRSKHRRLLHSFASLGAVLVIGGSIAYLNKGSVELQVASVRAGFQASAPGYEPTGFQRIGTETGEGKVAIKFASPIDKSNFTLSQEASDWDSQTLFDSVVASNNSSYQTVLSGGRTIFLYGNNEAAWVDGGILYKVQGNANLSQDEISSLATSM